MRKDFQFFAYIFNLNDHFKDQIHNMSIESDVLIATFDMACVKNGLIADSLRIVDSMHVVQCCQWQRN